MRSGILHWLIPAFGSVLAVILLFVLYRGLDAALFLDAFMSADPRWLFVLCLTILAEQLLRGFKWRQILYDLKPVSAYRLFGSILAGYGANILVPLGISPVVRSWIVARLERLHLACVLATAAIDRFVDGVVFAAIAAGVAAFSTLPVIEGNFRLALAAAGALNLVLFGGLLWVLFVSRAWLRDQTSALARSIDWLASKGGRRLENVRQAIADGILWPRETWRRVTIVLLSLAMKAIGATHFLWAGLAVGVILGFWDYLFLFLIAGFSLIIARFVRIPGGFVIGSGYALSLVGVGEEPALAMILFIHILTIILMVVPGLFVLWRSGITIRSLQKVAANADANA